MEIISAPGSKVMLSEREKSAYMEKKVYLPLPRPAKMLPSPLCVSPQHESVPEHIPTTFQPIQHSSKLFWLFLCIPFKDEVLRTVVIHLFITSTQQNAVSAAHRLFLQLFIL